MINKSSVTVGRPLVAVNGSKRCNDSLKESHRAQYLRCCDPFMSWPSDDAPRRSRLRSCHKNALLRQTSGGGVGGGGDIEVVS